jgi:hypothetical protein
MGMKRGVDPRAILIGGNSKEYIGLGIERATRYAQGATHQLAAGHSLPQGYNRGRSIRGKQEKK